MFETNFSTVQMKKKLATETCLDFGQTDFRSVGKHHGRTLRSVRGKNAVGTPVGRA